MRPSLPKFLSRQKVSFLLLCILFAVLWLAGGGSRVDIAGQVVMRATAWTLLVAGLLFGELPSPATYRPVWIILLALVVLIVIQVVPLPPATWQSLPGRAPLAEAALASGQPQPWRPWAIVPGGAINALSALIVPFTTLFLLSGLNEEDHARLPGLFLLLITTSTLIGLLQLSGTDYSTALVNGLPGQVSGIFANRNHFSLFLAFGCVVAPVWAFRGQRRDRRRWWRISLALGLVLLFVLMILATGSRAGIVVGVLALASAPILVWQEVRQIRRQFPPRTLIAIGAVPFALAGGLILTSLAAGRASSISRAFMLDPAQDMRARALPTIIGMIKTYLPLGSGFGSFDQVFRMYEPFALLNPSYFNHAHNDYVELLLEAGLLGLLLLVVAIGWWFVASLRARNTLRDTRDGLPLLGSTMLLLVAIASMFDYPARTPLIMVAMVLAAVWLSSVPAKSRSALPVDSDHL
jgi:O-antigen ligase